MQKTLPTRKKIRLEGYDYSQAGAYFVTLCVKGKHDLFGQVVGAVVNRPSYVQLTDIGKIIEAEIHLMQMIRKNVVVPKYIIMPNHIHMIVLIGEGRRLSTENGRLSTENGRLSTENGRLSTAPTLSEIVRLWKREISKQIGYSIWQKSFHDRIIRSEAEYQKIWQYIDENPALWAEDCYYTK